MVIQANGFTQNSAITKPLGTLRNYWDGTYICVNHDLKGIKCHNLFP